jgi:hypothetical protein
MSDNDISIEHCFAYLITGGFGGVGGPVTGTGPR